jgi:P27 family predicted phage terminase small subunit
LQLLRGNPSKRPLNKGAPVPDIPADVPEPPDFLSAYARDEWHRLAEGLHRLGLLTTLDVATFSVYCETFARWRQAEELLAQQAERDPACRALTIKTNTGSAMQNPLLRVAITAASDTVRFAAEFGLAPAARSRVAGSLTARMAPSKFDGLLGGP